MTRTDLRKELNISETDFIQVLKSCGYIDVKNFCAVKKGVVKKYVKMAKIEKLNPVIKDKKIVVTGMTDLKQLDEAFSKDRPTLQVFDDVEYDEAMDRVNEHQIQNEKITQIEKHSQHPFYKVSRKELIEVLAAAYNRGFKNGSNSLPSLKEYDIESLLSEAILIDTSI